MHKYNTEGIVLKSTNYADKDKIYTILTRDYGKVRVLARGVRKITSRRAGNLDTLNYVSLKLTESSGFKNLDEAVVLESFRDIKNDLSISMSAYYLAEIVFRSVEEDDTSPEIFYLLLSTLKKLNQDTALTVNYFEVNLLKKLGYALNLDKCVVCERKMDNTWRSYSFNLDMGGFICNNCEGFGFKVFPDTVYMIQDLQKGKFPVTGAVQDVKVLKQVDSLIKGFVSDNLDVRFKSLELTDR